MSCPVNLEERILGWVLGQTARSTHRTADRETLSQSVLLDQFSQHVGPANVNTSLPTVRHVFQFIYLFMHDTVSLILTVHSHLTTHYQSS